MILTQMCQICRKTAFFSLATAFVLLNINGFSQSGGLKDIKSTMKIGWCVTDGTKTYFSNATAKSLSLSNINSANVQCYPAWGRWDETLKHVYHLDAFNNQVKELHSKNIYTSAHMLLGWDQYFPNWYINGDFEADTVEAIMNSWIKSIITFKGNDTLVDNWNVVNEAMMWDGKGSYWPVSGVLKNSCELERMGFEPDASGLPADKIVNSQHPVYIRRAFVEARKYTDKDLELRDASIEFPNDQKYKSFYQLVMHLLNSGAPLTAVSLQTHLNLEGTYDWDAYTNNIKRYRELGLKVNITEADFGDTKKTWTDDKAQLQKSLYYQLVTAAIRGGAYSFETWGFIDGNNLYWRDGEKGLIFSSSLTPKPAYFGIRNALVDMSHILFWEMDNAVDSKVPDVTMYNNFGTLNNNASPTFTSGYKNSALQFDGVDDFVSGDFHADTIENTFAFSCFIKTTSSIPSTIGDLGTENTSGIKLGINANGKLIVEGAGLSKTMESVAAVNDDDWHFVAVKKDGDNFRLFLDSAVPVDNCTGNSAKFVKLNVGADISGNGHFSGVIDEVKLYDWAVEDSSFVRNILPNAPSALNILKYVNYLKLSWADMSSNEEGFIVERKTADGVWETIDTVDANIKSFSDSQYEISTSYTYRVKSYNRFGEAACIMTKTVTSPLVGIEDNNISDSEKYQIYPNPVSENYVLSSSIKGNYSIFSLNGILMERGMVLPGENHFSAVNLPEGIFLFRIENDKEIRNTKMVINR